MLSQYDKVKVISGKWAGSYGDIQSIEPFEVEVLLTVVLPNGSRRQFSATLRPSQLQKIPQYRSEL